MRRYEKHPEAYPQEPFDLVKEAFISGVVVLVLVLAAAWAFGAPFVKPLTIKKVATTQPVLFMKTAARDLGGISTIAEYGPPYNHGTAGVQSLGFFHPQTMLGVTTPINPTQRDVIRPLEMAASLDPSINVALSEWTGATPTQRKHWVQTYLSALSRARVVRGKIILPVTADGPVPAMMSSLHKFAEGGLMSGALNRSAPVYRYDVAPSLLFLQGAPLHQMAKKQDLLGEQWGIMHDELSYPGPWWLTPYTALYQFPPYSTSSAGDLMAAYTMLVVFLALIVLPFIPSLKDLPRRLRVYRLVWRDWYHTVEGKGSQPPD